MSDKSYLNWPFLEPKHRELAETLDAWAAENIDSNPHPGPDVDDECKELVQKLAEGGWLNYAVALRSEGQKLDVRSLCLIRETLGRYSGLADFAFAMQGLGSGSISLFGSDALQQEYLSAVREGKKIAAFALTEPDAGSDVAAMSTTAEDAGDHYIVNGEKTFISNGGIADYYVLFARTGDAGAKGISAMILDADTEGLEIAERIQVCAPHPLARLKMTNCKIPKSKLLGNEGEGFKISMATLDVFRSTVGAASLGFARRALDEAIARTTSRELFGAPMADLQLVQTQLAEMALDIDASALLIYRAAWTKDCVAERVTREAAMAKLYATEASQKAIDTAVQLFGGLGVTVGMPVEELYREVRALRIYEGASEVQKLIIAKQTLMNEGH
ncbi:acyl-CoA dehydrogenase family protein [uncultured Pseudoteredinibacter sp.]|uniref:acyl-CoA dehydrogenase family protein n=1 Tax=uncultured Pseudoteredinibacter sp. TaxID=1641701 RepID=UPI0026376595|nr:acyl-CoA dehydrogenase family protein [uncultured Pseudoteredinibacter sp.]MCV6620406.1 acyl-CoA dehydrogenase family protein [Cellvibrionaceae bacterium]